jgi:hypothetical protein
MIEPYDITLNKMNSLEGKEWAKEVFEQVLKLTPK